MKPSVNQHILPLWEALQVGGIQGVYLRLHLFQRRAWLEASDVVPVVAMAASLLLRRECERNPQADFRIDKQELARHHTDNREWPPTEAELPPENSRVTSIEPVPERMAQDDFLFAADLPSSSVNDPGPESG